jgi:hypothetical protein
MSVFESVPAMFLEEGSPNVHMNRAMFALMFVVGIICDCAMASSLAAKNDERLHETTVGGFPHNLISGTSSGAARKIGFRDLDNLAPRYAGGGLEKGAAAVRKANHRQLRHNQIYGSCRGQW